VVSNTGHDPIIGQTTGQLTATGVGVSSTEGSTGEHGSDKGLNLDTWVVPRGGEYFWVPSMKFLRGEFEPSGSGSGAGAGGSGPEPPDTTDAPAAGEGELLTQPE
jgi:hypothetical protein